MSNMERFSPPPEEASKPKNQLNHQDNLNHLTGWYHGDWYQNGIPNPGGTRLDSDHLLVNGQVLNIPRPKKRNHGQQR